MNPLSLLTNAKSILIIVSLVATVGGGWAAKWYIGELKDDILTLQINNALLDEANTANLSTIDRLQVENAENVEELTGLNRRLDTAREYQDTLLEKLHDHDLTRLSEQRPGLIEGVINNGTEELFDELETITSN
jgi:hypothetical protein